MLLCVIIPKEQCLCVLCDLGVVEDESHLVFHCSLYNDSRNVLFERIQGKNLDLYWLTEGHMLSCFFMKISSVLLHI